MAEWWTGKRYAVKRELQFFIPMKNWSGRRDLVAATTLAKCLGGDTGSTPSLANMA